MQSRKPASKMLAEEHANQQFSKLEASFATTAVVPRENSIEMKDVWRHAQNADLLETDLDLNFWIDETYHSPEGLQSLQDYLSGVQYQRHLSNVHNFCEETNATVFSATSTGAEWVKINDNSLQILLEVSGRWAPQARRELDDNGKLAASDFFCQHPRWNLQMQGAPLSVYMRSETRRQLVTYIISHKRGDTSIDAVQRLLTTAVDKSGKNDEWCKFLHDPLDIAVILSALSFEASKHHVKRFQRYMWTQINKVDDHLAGLATAERSRLGELTKSLQIISQQANSHLLNADVAIITGRGIRELHKSLHEMLQTPIRVSQRSADTISYIIESVEKQRMLFKNYQSRKDGTMSLVYNLVTQQDAANNIELAASMKQDSASMNAIAALTMVFLPGTFTASVLSAGIFSSVARSRTISVSGIWWLWVAITVPLTVIVLTCWVIYKKLNALPQPKLDVAGKEHDEFEDEASKRPLSRTLTYLTRNRSSRKSTNA
ncbi:hypothetical protein BCR34DRAFT_647262 [Clohesyomyces aquaticus]|uniref:Cora-like Mg2+ transporter protein-domain-containing protein n=1 Tax=Clohesyomyces aquaticus TaxID=1231657 RepID=A0A1Y1ZUY6_9PLEO|nr:hypothetical protein BCR34DRAFT_647262 [Clohesyomyces aquaticus]